MKRKLILIVLFLSQITFAQTKDEGVEIVVTANPIPKNPFESAQPVSVLDKKELTTIDSSSLGNALKNEAGVTSSSFSPGAGRPIIRGLGGDRVRIMENGLATNDVSNTSPDHPVNTDVLNADQIEIVRGPATLMYGPSAIGGAINVIDGKIPEELPLKDIEGSAVVRGGTADRERSAGIEATTFVDNVAFHFDASTRRSDDYKINGYARTKNKREAEELEFPEPYGTLDFSDSFNRNLSFGSSYIFNEGFLGAAITYIDSEYGLPNGENDVSIDMRQPRLELKGRYNSPAELLRYLSFNSGISDYKHTEFEGEEVGTIFKNKGNDSRIEIGHEKLLGTLEGAFGVQFQNTKFKAIGDEAYQAPTDTLIVSPYLFEEVPLNDKFTFQTGIRTDSQSTDVTDYTSIAGETFNSLSRDFTSFSQSVGITFLPYENYSFGLSISNSERAPVGQELFANGPHVATAAYEIGDINLKKEKALGVDLTLRRKDGLLTGSLGGFVSRYRDYIGLNANGEELDGLPVFLFQSQNVDFHGIESLVSLNLAGKSEFERSTNDLSIFVQQDWVWAKDRDSNDALPRIPPLRLITGLNYKKDSFGAKFEVEHSVRQDRVTEFESETPSYTTLNIVFTKDVELFGYMPTQLFVEGRNLTNEQIRNHTSFIKDLAPLMGVNVMAGLRISF